MSDNEFYHEALVRRIRDRDDCDDDLRGACDEIEGCYEAIRRLEAKIEARDGECDKLRARLRLADAALRSDSTLTDEEREAIEQSIDSARGGATPADWTIPTLRKLLERLA